MMSVTNLSIYVFTDLSAFPQEKLQFVHPCEPHVDAGITKVYLAKSLDELTLFLSLRAEELADNGMAIYMFVSNSGAWLPDGDSQILRSYLFGPSGFWTMAPLCCAAKFDPFLSLDCALHPGAIQGKEGIKFCSVA